jgi:protein TonB
VRQRALDVVKARRAKVAPAAPEPEPASPIGAGPLRVGGDVKAPIVIRRVEPVIPEAARKARVAGIVILETVIDKEGRVADAKVLKGLPLGLDEAALEAVKQWTFRPGTLNGEPVDVIFHLTVNMKGE